MPVGFKLTEVGVIPKDWDVGKIKEHTVIKTGKRNTQDRVDDGQYPFFVRSQTIEWINSYSFDGEAVLTAGDGVGTGKVFHYINGRFDYHQRVYRISDFSPQLNGRFFHLIFSTRFYDRIMSMTAKSSVDSVRLDMIAEMQVPLPPLPEQRAIAGALSDVDALIGALDRLIAKKRDLKQAAMQRLLTGKTRLPGFRDAWEITRFSDIADKSVPWSIGGGPFGSNLKASDYTDKGVRIIQLQNIGDGRFHDEYAIYTSDAKADELLSNNIYPGEIILSKMGDPVARACFVPSEDPRYLMASDGIRLAVDSRRFNKRFVHDYINSVYFRRTAIEASTGSTRQRIGLVTLKQLPFVAPPLPEQTAIAAVLSDMDAELAALEQRREKTRALKQGMMQELLTGRIRLV